MSMSKIDPVKIQATIEKALIKEFESMLGSNADDILLQELIKCQKNRIEIKHIDLDLLVEKLDRR